MAEHSKRNIATKTVPTKRTERKPAECGMGKPTRHEQERAIIAAGALTPEQVVTALLKASGHKLTSAEIAKTVGAKAPAAWPATWKLVAKGFVKVTMAKDSPDKRQHFAITSAGREAFKDLVTTKKIDDGTSTGVAV